MNQNLRFALKFDADTGQFVTNVRAGDRAIDKLGNQSSEASRQLGTLNQQSDMLSGGMASLRTQLLAVAGGFSAIAALSDATRTLATYQDMRTQITALVGGQQQWIETEQYLIATSTTHNKVLTDMSRNYARLASLQEAGLVNGMELRLLFEGMSDAQSQTGASGAQLEQVMYGLSQALASPIVRAEELNQVVEPLPGLLNKLDKAAGLQSGGFRKMLLEGQITSAFFKDTLIKALREYDGAAERTANNINARFNAVKNAYQQTVVAFEQPLNDSLGPFLTTTADGLQVLAENAETVSQVIEIALLVSLTRGAAALSNMTVAKVADMAASRARTKEVIATTTATIASTQAEITHLQTLQVSNNQKFRAIGGDKALAVARGHLTVATKTLTAAQTRLNVVSRAGGIALGIMGGPLGVAMLAASAIGYFAVKAMDAREKVKDLDTEVAKLSGSFDTLNRVQREIMISELNREMEETRQTIAETEAEIKRLEASLLLTDTIGRTFLRSKIIGLKDEVVALGNEITVAAAKQQELFNAGLPKLTGFSGDDETDSIENTISAGERRLAQLQQQIALLGQVGELARVNYEIESGAIEDLTDAMAEKLRLAAKELDQRRQALAAQERYRALQARGQDELQRLERSIALHGQAGEVARLRWELEHGSLQNVNSALAENILLQAARLDQLNVEEADTSAVDAFREETAALDNAWQLRQAIIADRENEAKIREQAAYEDRTIALSQSFQDAYHAARDNQELQDELEREYFASRETLWAEHQANLSDIERTQQENRAAFQQQVASQTLTFTEQQLSITTNFLKQAGKEHTGIYRMLFLAQKAAAIPSMVIATEEASAKALAAFPPPVGPILSGAVRAMGYASIGIATGTELAGQAHDGIWRVPKENEGTWMLKNNEMVLNQDQADNFRWMVGVMNQMKQSQLAAAARTQQYAAGGNVNVAAPPVHVAFLDDQTQLDRYLQSDLGQEAVVKIVQRNRNSF
uniref:tape measure protein n=1 Tax=Thaumasiovibrio occultus TaxID=1891184 RepID=UPI000B351F9C|nr:tape measure protein [Thaumasiovibrio occultus]